MKKEIMLITAIVLGGCSNAAYQQQAQPFDGEGFYFGTIQFMTSITNAGVKIDSDGTGFFCQYGNDGKPATITPIKHIGGGEWATPSSIMGLKGYITKNPDGSINYGSYRNMVLEKIENTSCKR